MKAGQQKRKGKRLEQKIAKLLRSSGLDKRARTSFQSGAHWSWKSDIYTSLPFAIEAKNQERVRLWDFWQQARDTGTVQKPPVLMVSGNNRPILAIMALEDWINLVKEMMEYKNG
ncbi:MAG: hypothetical protein KAJ75_06910 [Alphaproteobacteria bacterium]|nr:hypothetical protein [Alphaproteobacteria bacterium]